MKLQLIYNYYYYEQFIQQQINLLSVGLKLDKIENYYIEERRIAHNSTEPEIELDKTITDTPTLAMLHLLKSIS